MARILLVVCFIFASIFYFVNTEDYEADIDSEQDDSLYSLGDVMLGGLFPVHLERIDGRCINLQHDALVWTEAMVLAIEEINRNSTLLPNISLGYNIFDSCGNVRTAMEWAADFVFNNTLKFDHKFKVANECRSSANEHYSTRSVESPVVSVIGSDFSDVSINVANMLQLVDIPQISYASTSSDLSDKAEYGSFFRTVPPDNLQSRAMVDLLAHNRWSCVAVLGVDDPYGLSGVDSFVDEAAKQNVCIAVREFFPATDSENVIKAIISKLKQKRQIEICVLYCLAPHAVKVLDEALRQNLTLKTWIASEGWAESSYVVTEKYLPVIHGSVGFVLKDVTFKGLQTHLRGLNSSVRNTVWWKEFWRKQYNCDITNSQNNTSLTRCIGNETLPKSIYSNYLLARKAAYVRDAVHAAAIALDSLLNCPSQDATRSSIKCGMSARELHPKEVLRALHDTSFQGLTGFLDFKSKRRVRATYDIVNFVQGEDQKVKFVTVGSWAEDTLPRLQINDSKIHWCQGIRPRAACGDNCPPGTWQGSTVRCLWECIRCDGDNVSSKYAAPSCTKCQKGFIANANHTKCMEVPLDYIKLDEADGIVIVSFTGLCILGTLLVIAVTAIHHKAPVMKETGLSLNLLLLIEVLLSYVFNFILISKPTDFICRFLPVYFYIIYTSAAVTILLKTLRIWILLAKPSENQRGLAMLRSWRLYIVGVAIFSVPVLFSVIGLTTDPPSLDKYVYSPTRVFGICVSSTLGQALRFCCTSYLTLLCFIATAMAYKTKSLPHFQKFHEAKHLAYAMTVFTLTLCTFYPGWFFIKGPIRNDFACVTNMVAATGTILCSFGPKMVVIFWRADLNESIHVHPAPRVRPRRAPTGEHAGSMGELYFCGTATPSPPSRVRSRAQSRLTEEGYSNTSTPDGQLRRANRKKVKISTDVESIDNERL